MVKILLDGPTGTDWTEISVADVGGIIDYEWSRGRSDTLGAFGAGTLKVYLDNSDRRYDPANPTGLVYAADGKGLPLCPVEFYLTPQGGTETLVLGGFQLGPVCWEGGTTAGSVVTLEAMDPLGFSPSVPADKWAAMIKATRPDVWLPMDVGFPVLTDGSEVPNRTNVGGHAVLENMPAPPDFAIPTTEGSLSTLALDMPGPGRIRVASTLALPADAPNVTVAVLWASKDELGMGESARVVSMSEPGGPTLRWTIQVDEDGVAQVETFDAGGSSIDTATITPSLLPRWDGGEMHLVIARFTSGNTLDVWFGGDTATLTAAATVYESDLVIGESDDDYLTAEVTVWHRALDDLEIAALVFAAGGVGGPWFGDTYLGDGPNGQSRLGHWYAAAGRSEGTDEWHVPNYDPDYPSVFHGLYLRGNNPSTFAEALRETAGPRGAAYALRDGRMRVRTGPALDDSAFAAVYTDPVVTFTDRDDTLDPDEYRHAGIRQAEPDLATVLNRAEVTWLYLTDPEDPNSGYRATVAPENGASIGRYGEQGEEFLLLTTGWREACILADWLVATYADPQVLPQSITLDAVGDPSLTAWLVDGCELEVPIVAVYTPTDGVPVSLTGLRIQGERVVGNHTTFTAELTVGRS